MGGFFKQTIRDVPLEGKTVLVRADYNVPLDSKGQVSDDLRIRASVPTLNYLLEHKCKVVIISHLGRPDGKHDERYSLAPVAKRLAELTGHAVRMADTCIGDRAYQTAKTAPKDTIVLFENVRFHAEEEANDGVFAQKIAKASGVKLVAKTAVSAEAKAPVAKAAPAVKKAAVAKKPATKKATPKC